MSRTYSDRVMRFRRSVYPKRPGLTAGCRVLLLRLSDDMSATCKVSIPRSKLAAEFGVAPARITNWVALAKELGFLSTVRRGRPGVTAVYQGMIPTPLGTRGSTNAETPDDTDLVREGVPSTWYGTLYQAGVREGVPQNDPTWYARAGSQEVVGNGTSGTESGPQRKGAPGEVSGCDWCSGAGCPQCDFREEIA